MKKLLSLMFLVITLAGCASAPGSGALVTETFMVPGLDPGIQIHVREKRLAGSEAFAPEKIVLFVHGATFPSETAFDLDLPGGAWMDYAARRGFDTYIVDVRGYGRSTRPAAMDQPPAANAPFGGARDAVRDVAVAVDFILKPSGVMQDLNDWWAKGKPTYDAAAVRAPTLLIVGEWDAITPPEQAQALFKRLVNAKHRRVVVMSEGSHAMSVEKNRMHLIREVQNFLEEPQ